MRLIIVNFLILASVFLMPLALEARQMAQKDGGFPVADFAELQNSPVFKVTQVIDPQTIALEDKRVIELTGIDFPDLKVYDAGDFAVTAKKVLTEMLTDKKVTLYQTKQKDWGRSNRMGHELAHVERVDDKAWVQGTLLSLGLARVRTTASNREMAKEMYRLEQQARAEKLGLWSDERFKIMSPEEAGKNLYTFQIVEGTVDSTALKSNRLYLNFGKDWHKDFTVSIAPRDKRLFSEAGMDYMSWDNKRIRVRGWVRDYNGPYMEIDHPEALELLDVPKP